MGGDRTSQPRSERQSEVLALSLAKLPYPCCISTINSYTLALAPNICLMPSAGLCLNPCHGDPVALYRGIGASFPGRRPISTARKALHIEKGWST